MALLHPLQPRSEACNQDMKFVQHLFLDFLGQCSCIYMPQHQPTAATTYEEYPFMSWGHKLLTCHCGGAVKVQILLLVHYQVLHMQEW